jgi:hypothetical protein
MGKLDPWKLLRNPHTTSKHGPPRKGRKLSFRAMRGLPPGLPPEYTDRRQRARRFGRPRAANAVRLALLRVPESRRANCGRTSQYARSGRRPPTTVDRRGGGLASKAAAAGTANAVRVARPCPTRGEPDGAHFTDWRQIHARLTMHAKRLACSRHVNRGGRNPKASADAHRSPHMLGGWRCGVRLTAMTALFCQRLD